MKSRTKTCRFSCFLALFFCAALPLRLEAEPIRVQVAGSATVSYNNSGVAITLSYSDAALILLGEEVRFFRGIELEFTVPQAFLPYRGSLALIVYSDLDRVPAPGVADIDARQYSFDPVPNKIQSIYQIPLRIRHGLRTTPYVQIQSPVLSPSSFPILFRVMPIIKGLNDEIETMRFTLTVKPILSDEGAVYIVPRYPENLPDRPFTALIDDEVVERLQEERLLREGEHHLTIISNDYRNESRVFHVERGKIQPLTITLQDPTPLVIFEGPDNARIFFDNQPVNSPGPLPVEPGLHEVRFQLSDYAIIKTLSVQRGKTYRLSLAIDMIIQESD
jgi:hypothetical protein